MVAGLEVISEGTVLDQVELCRSRLDELLLRASEHVFRREARMLRKGHVYGSVVLPVLQEPMTGPS